MRFVICGAGAIGGVLGGQLAMAGFAVIYIDKIAEHVLAINTQGLSTAMAVAREQPGTYTVQQPWERVQA